MKNKEKTNRITIHDADIPMDKNDTLDLSEVPDEELFVKDEDIIGLSDDSPLLIKHTDETLDDAEDEIIFEENYDVNAETIIAPSELELPSDYNKDDEDKSQGDLKIGDVFDTDAQAVVEPDDSDETISGLEEDIADFVEGEESDTSERIIVSEPITIEKEAPKQEVREQEEIVKQEIQEPDDEILELGTDAIVGGVEESEGEDETIELLVLAEEIIDKDSQDIRDIDDILGLGAEVLENTRELIMPVGFLPDENLSEEDILRSKAEAKMAEDDSFMNEVRQILTEQEKEIASARPADDSFRKFSENISSPEAVIEPPEQISSAEDEAVFDLDSKTIIAKPDVKDDMNQPDVDIDFALAEKVFEKAEDEVKIDEPLHQDKEDNHLSDDNVLDIDIDMALAEKVFEKAEDEEEDFSDSNAETVIMPSQFAEKIDEPVSENKNDDNLLDIDIDLALDEEVFEKAEDEEEDFSDSNAETVIMPSVANTDHAIRKDDDANLLDIDVDLDMADSFEQEVISDLNAETIVSLPEDIKPDKKVIDISEEDDVFDLSPETIVSSPSKTESISDVADSTTDISTSQYDSTTDISSHASLPNEREAATVIFSEAEISKEINLLDKDFGMEKEFARENSKDLESQQLPAKREHTADVVNIVSEEPPQDPEILDGEELKDEEKDLLNFLEMEIAPVNLPKEAADKKELEERDLELDEYVPISEVIKNPHEGEGTVIEDMIRPMELYESRTESSVYISITPEQMEAALERVIQKVFTEKIEHIVTQVIEKTFTEELEKKLRIILMQDDERR